MKRFTIRRAGPAIGLIIALLLGVLFAAPPARAELDAVIAESEPNNTSATAQNLGAIGLANPVSAQINQGGDVDWYRFSAVEGRTYVVELFNVSSSLGQGGSGYYSCAGNSGYFSGLALLAFDPATDSSVAGQCSPNGDGNTLVSITFKATSSQARLQVYAQASGGVGAYRLRVLPKYGEQGAAWDQTTFEPNNRQESAFLLNVGREQAVTSAIEARDSIYATNSGDDDWYRFNATQGRTYVVELFNVSSSLGQGSSGYYNCAGNSGYFSGLALLAFDPATDSSVAGQCSPNDGGNVLTSIEFKAGGTGPITLLVYGQVASASGRYSLRILPKYDEQGAAWDQTTFEPNNRAANAYLLGSGRPRSVSSSIIAHDSTLATNWGDNDWYRFNATAGETYTVELFNVSASLSARQSGYYNCAGTYGYYRGLALIAYDAATDSQITARCQPNTAGAAHSSIEFKAPSTGVVTLLIYPHDSEASGGYSLRVNAAGEQIRVYLPLLRR